MFSLPIEKVFLFYLFSIGGINDLDTDLSVYYLILPLSGRIHQTRNVCFFLLFYKKKTKKKQALTFISSKLPCRSQFAWNVKFCFLQKSKEKEKYFNLSVAENFA